MVRLHSVLIVFCAKVRFTFLMYEGRAVKTQPIAPPMQ